MESKKTVDEQTSGLGESSSHSNPPRVLCSYCKTKITADDFMGHFFNCQGQTGEIGIQTTMGK